MAGFTVVDCSTVVATHLSHLMQVHAAKLLGRVETQQLVEHVTKLAPKLIEDVIPKMVGIAALQKVLQLLLEEGVHIRDMRSIVECLAEYAATVTDPAELARRIRVHLAPSIVQQIYGPTKELEVIALEPELERMVTQALNSPHGAALDPGVADTLAKSAAESAKRQEDLGHPACLLVPDLIRAPMARLLKRAAPRLKVLSHSEIPETHSIRIGSIIGGSSMNVKRFTARTSRERSRLVRAGPRRRRRRAVDQASPDGVEVLAMAPDRHAASARAAMAARRTRAGAAPTPTPRVAARAELGRRTSAVEQDADAPRDEHAVVPGLRARAHAQAPPGVARRRRSGRPAPTRGASRLRRGADAGRAADRAAPRSTAPATSDEPRAGDRRAAAPRRAHRAACATAPARRAEPVRSRRRHRPTSACRRRADARRDQAT